MPRLFRDCVSFQRPQRSKLWICPPFGKASGPGGAFLPFAESLPAKRRLPVSLRRGKPQRSGVYRAGAGPGGCFSRAPLVPAWVAGSSRTALSGLRTRQRPHDWGEKPKGWLRQAAGRGEWRRFAVVRGSAALPVVVPARARDRNGRVPCPRQRDCRPRAGRAPRAGHRRSASAPRPLLLLLLLLLLPPGHLLRAVPQRAAPATCALPQPPATHRNYRPPGTGLSGFPPE